MIPPIQCVKKIAPRHSIRTYYTWPRAQQYKNIQSVRLRALLKYHGRYHWSICLKNIREEYPPRLQISKDIAYKHVDNYVDTIAVSTKLGIIDVLSVNLSINIYFILLIKFLLIALGATIAEFWGDISFPIVIYFLTAKY